MASEHYQLQPETYKKTVKFIKNELRLALVGRNLINFERVDPATQLAEFETIVSPQDTTMLFAPGSEHTQVGAIKYKKERFLMWSTRRHYDISEYDIRRDKNGFRQDTVRELVRSIGEFEDSIIFDGFKTLSGAGVTYLNGATGYIGIANNTVAATTAWDSGGNPHNDILAAYGKLAEDNVPLKDMYLVLPAYEDVMTRNRTAQGHSIRDQIAKSFPEIKSILISGTLPASTGLLIAKNSQYAKMLISEDMRLIKPVPTGNTGQHWRFNIVHTFGLKIKEPNSVCSLTGI